MLKLLHADVILGAFLLIVAVRFLERRADAYGCAPPVFLRYWSWMGLVALALLFSELHTTFSDIMLATGWLDPAAVARQVRRQMAEENDMASFADWEEEASLEQYPFLRLFSITAPFWVVATFLICFAHIWLHGSIIRECCNDRTNRSADIAVCHDKTVRILFLPVLYGLMSLQGLKCTWQTVLNNCGSRHFQSWEERVAFLDGMYAASFYVGDVYESYALLIFATLIMKVLKRHVNIKVSVAKKEVSRMKAGTKSFGSAASARAADESSDALTPRRRRARSSTVKSFRDLHDIMADLMERTRGLTILGIKLFCITCAGQAMYNLCLQFLGFYDVFPEYFGVHETEGSELGLLQTEKSKAIAGHAFYGAGFVASFAAIGNIIEVERGFHIYLHEFGPVWKFVGVKVLVSIAFLQSLVLFIVPPFASWSTTRQNLFYAALLCFECFLISLLHLCAWSPYEEWYRMQDAEEASSKPRVRSRDTIGALFGGTASSFDAGLEGGMESDVEADAASRDHAESVPSSRELPGDHPEEQVGLLTQKRRTSVSFSYGDTYEL